MNFKKYLLFFIPIFFLQKGFAHPMPNSVLLLDVKQKNISAELKLPLKEMQYAISFDVTKFPELIIPNHHQEIANYLLAHIHPKAENGEVWQVEIGKMQLDSTEQDATGKYNELTVFLNLIPPQNTNTRKFILYYDAIVHQVVTHKILVSIRQDFDNGKMGEQETQVGIIYMKPSNNIVEPLEINLEKGSVWKGFKSMVHIGMQHIAEGTDHLLFILVLLLAAPMIATKKNWTNIGTTKYTLIRVLKIITAFTIGHSITLIIASLGLLKLPTQPVEILIAISILITAIHAITPIFPNKEIYVATGFGLIHGLAFAAVLSNLQLNTGRMVLSIFGFNIGIEIMQLFVVLLIFPWLLILSTTNVYKWVRMVGAILAGIASISWIIERIYQKPNVVSEIVKIAAENGKYFVLILAFIAIIFHLKRNKKKDFVIKN